MACCMTDFDPDTSEEAINAHFSQDMASSVDYIDSSAFFVIQKAAPTGGPIEWGEHVVFRHMNSGRYLTTVVYGTERRHSDDLAMHNGSGQHDILFY